MDKALALSALLLAGCGGGSAVTPTTAAPVLYQRPLTIAVVGDSISRLRVLPESPVPCGYPAGGTPACGYSTDGSASWPAALTVTGPTVVNLSSPGCRTVEPFPGTTPVIAQVAQIPTNADVVVWESGTNDTSAHGTGPQYAADIAAVGAAIHAQVPGARIVVVGVRYFFQPIDIRNRVDAWNTLLAAQGTFIDLRPWWPSGVGPDWPDGTHPGPNAVEKIAALVNAVL